MQNSEQIREFFKKMADGRVLNANHKLLHDSKSIPVQRLNQEKPLSMQTVSLNDFGVGLPPLAHG